MQLKNGKVLKNNYFTRPFFSASQVYICGDMECDVVFPCTDGNTTCPRCGCANTAPLTKPLGSHIQFLKVTGEKQLELEVLCYGEAKDGKFRIV